MKPARRPWVLLSMFVVTAGVIAGLFLYPSHKSHAASGSFMYLDQKIAYDRSGTGSIVVLVPGLHIGQTEYDQVKAALSAGHDVLVFDMLGQGQSSCPNINYNHGTQVEILGAILANQNITTAHLVGVREGAAIAAKFAAANPTKVKSLALLSPMDVEYKDAMGNPISPNTAPTPSPGYFYRRFLPPTAVTEAFGALAYVLNSSATSTRVNKDNAVAMFTRQFTNGCYSGGRVADKTRINDWFTIAEGTAIGTANTPTTILWGDGDQINDAGYQGAWKAALTKATVTVIKAGATPPTCGLDFLNECPSQASTALNAWFTANGG